MRGRELEIEVGGNSLAAQVVGFGFLAHYQLVHQWHTPPTHSAQGVLQCELEYEGITN